MNTEATEKDIGRSLKMRDACVYFSVINGKPSANGFAERASIQESETY